MKELKGIPVSDGQALGKILIVTVETLVYEKCSIKKESLEDEKEKLQQAFNGAMAEIKELTEKAEPGEQKEIFECYIEMLRDPELIKELNEYLEKELVTVESSLSYVCEKYVNTMLALEDPYFQARADDFKQIFRIMFRTLQGKKATPTTLNEPFILAAKEIGPADMAKVNKNLLQGFILETGSKTSHAAIISRAMGIPMISGLTDIENSIKNNDYCAIDGFTGTVHINPSDELIKEFECSIKCKKDDDNKALKMLNEEAITLDGKHITLYANIGTTQEVEDVLKANADGIGLFRTEFLFMENGGNRLPTEEEQFKAYKSVVSALGEKPVIFRTLDAGGDKHIEALGIPKEDNPFLGWRAIRYCLKNTDIFKTQIRALLRASHYGNLKIMIPMIISKDEIVQSKKIIDEAYAELKKEGLPFKQVPVGIMIETPAAAVNAEELATVSDFFSIGTNDLTQYTLAVDRGNNAISDLYDEGHPAVLALIKHVISVGEKAGITVDLCGEMAGNSTFTEALLKSGLKDFSMSPILILKIKKLIRSLSTD